MKLDPTPAMNDPFDGVDFATIVKEDKRIQSTRRGKVRDIIDLGDRLILIATDRLSAFDQALGVVPYRGQVLNQLSAWWFSQLGDIVDNHLLSVPDPNVSVVCKVRALPVEVVVRDRLTGSSGSSLWTLYQSGEREIYGMTFPEGLEKNSQLARPIITPTTKAASGHDMPLSESAVVAEGLVDVETWEVVRETALRLFERGKKIALAAGLVLADTKYEFGLDTHKQVVLIDEAHTPDSSRFWRASDLTQRLAAGLEPENLDKEIVRLAYVEQGFNTNEPLPPIPPSLASRLSHKYVEVYEMLTKEVFVPAPHPAAKRIRGALKSFT